MHETDTVVVEEADTGYRFSWPLAFAGALAATATTFFLLTLGAGVGLFLVSPERHAGSLPIGFFTGGAIYFFAAQAFGFAVGGHLAGRLLGPLIETQEQEDVRAGAHGFVVWALTVVATATVLALAAVDIGGATAAMYGVSSRNAAISPVDYEVDRLFRPMQAQVRSGPDAEAAHAEAKRILTNAARQRGNVAADDRDRLAALTADQSGLARDAATERVDRMSADLQHKASEARRTAAYAALWTAFALLFGAIVSIMAAIHARIEDDRQTLAVR